MRPEPAVHLQCRHGRLSTPEFLYDEDEEVRKAAVCVVAELRDKPLQPFREL